MGASNWPNPKLLKYFLLLKIIFKNKFFLKKTYVSILYLKIGENNSYLFFNLFLKFISKKI